MPTQFHEFVGQDFVSKQIEETPCYSTATLHFLCVLEHETRSLRTFGGPWGWPVLAARRRRGPQGHPNRGHVCVNQTIQSLWRGPRKGLKEFIGLQRQILRPRGRPVARVMSSRPEIACPSYPFVQHDMIASEFYEQWFERFEETFEISQVPIS